MKGEEFIGQLVAIATSRRTMLYGLVAYLTDLKLHQHLQLFNLLNLSFINSVNLSFEHLY